MLEIYNDLKFVHMFQQGVTVKNYQITQAKANLKFVWTVNCWLCVRNQPSQTLNSIGLLFWLNPWRNYKTTQVLLGQNRYIEYLMGTLQGTNISPIPALVSQWWTPKLPHLVGHVIVSWASPSEGLKCQPRRKIDPLPPTTGDPEGS